MTTKKLTKLLALYLPYILLGLVATNFGEAWRLAEGKELGGKIMPMMGTIPVAFANPLPSLYPLDLLVGLCCGAGLRLAVYLRGKNAKKYRHGMEYGSARWGTPKDIEPFMAPKFADNIILTKTERLMMSNRPPDPKNARNKNVLVVGGSGSGKTRFWLKPNLLQCHSSYVVTDPKGSIVVECGNALLKNGYKLKILNTINFSKSMHYNPFAYVHSEKDVLKLVTTLMTNTKGEGSGGDPFWEKSERLLLTALIFNHHTNVDIHNRIVCFDIKQLGKQLKKLGMLIVQDAVWGRVTANRSAGKSTRYYADEFHLLLKEEQTAAYSVEIWKRFRKWGGIPTALTQNVKDLLASPEVSNIFENSDFVYMLNQANGDRQILAKQLNISPHQLSYVTHSGEGEGLLFFGNVILPFVDHFPKDLELYRILTTKLNEISEGAQK